MLLAGPCPDQEQWRAEASPLPPPHGLCQAAAWSWGLCMWGLLALVKRRCPGLLNTFLLLGREQSESRERTFCLPPSCCLPAPPGVTQATFWGERPPSGGLSLRSPSVSWGCVIMNLIPTRRLLSRPRGACIWDTGPSASGLHMQSPELGWGR